MDNKNQTTEYGKTYQLNGQQVNASGEPVQTKKKRRKFSEFFACFLLSLVGVLLVCTLKVAFYVHEMYNAKNPSASPIAPIGGGPNRSSDELGDFQSIDPMIDAVIPEGGNNKMDNQPDPVTDCGPLNPDELNDGLNSPFQMND